MDKIFLERTLSRKNFRVRSKFVINKYVEEKELRKKK